MEKRMRDHLKDRFGGTSNITINPPLPSSLNIELNNTCNQHCVFCPFHGQYTLNGVIPPAQLDSDFVKNIIDSASDLGIGRKEIGFYLAGEALLYKELPGIISYAKKRQFPYVFITTNGALATPERIEELIASGLDSIRFSVNAADRETYRVIHGTDDYETVLESIKYLHEYRKKTNTDIAISLSCVVTYMTKGIEDDIRYVFGRYVDDIIIIPVYLHRLTKSDFLENEVRMLDLSDAKVNKNYTCPILFNTMYIDAFGHVVPCCNAYDETTYFWDIKDNLDLEAAWNCDEYNRYRAIFLSDGDDEGTLCRNCFSRMKDVKYREGACDGKYRSFYED